MQVVNSPTRLQAILDKILTNIQHLYQEPLAMSPIGLSDHNAVLWRPINSTTRTNRIHQRIVRPIKDSDKRAFGEWISKYNWSSVNSASSTNLKAELFYEILKGSINKHFPTKVISTHCEDKPWISPYLKSLIMKRQKTFLNGNLNLWRSLRNKVSRLIKIAKQTFYDGSVSRLKKSNPRQWHQQIKRMSGHNAHQNFISSRFISSGHRQRDQPQIYFCSQ